MRVNQYRPKRVVQTGVTLIEVLVSVLILAVGLLGLAALLGNAMQSNQHAQARTQAVFLAGDMMERMRANRTNSGAYSLAEMDATSTPDCNSAWVPAATGSIAENDISEWQNSLRCYLPDGNGSVQVNATTRAVTVVVSWVAIDETDDDDGNQSREAITLVSEL